MPYLNRAVFTLLGIISFLIIPLNTYAAPADYQRCNLDTTCVVGEYFFDDNSQPITTGAVCTLNSYDPSDALHFNNISLTPTADGWYAHNFSTSGYNQGVYRGTLCCTYSGDQLCIDKSFQIVDDPGLTAQEVENAVLNADLTQHTTAGSVGERLNDPELTNQDVEDAVWDADPADHNSTGTFGNIFQNLNDLSAAEVWSYSNRSLTGFGTLVTDIWGHSTRTLTSFGSLVTDIWDNTPDEIATETDINNQTTTIQGNINNQTTTIQGDIDDQTTTLNQSIVDNSNEANFDSLETNINSLSNNIDDQGDDINTLSNTVNSQGSDIDNISTAINNQGTDITTLTSQITNLASTNSEELQQLSNQIQSNREYLENISNSPIIVTQGNTFDSSQLESQITQAQDYLNQLYANNQQVISKLGLLLLSWDSFSDTQISQELESLLNDLGTDANSPDYSSSITYQLSWLANSWPTTTTNTSYTEANNSLTNLEKAFNQIDVSGKSDDSKELLNTALTQLESVESLIGNISSATNNKTLNGLVKLIKNYLDALSSSQSQLDNLLSNWNSYNPSELEYQLDQIESQVLDVNQIPKASSILNTTGGDQQETLHNRALALNALIDLNQKLWANQDNKPIQSVWLETRGADIAFRSAVYNPATDQSQSHSLQYYLPKELSENDILSREGDVNTEYDATQELVSVSANYNLKPQTLALGQLATKDFWNYSEDELKLIQDQAQDMVDSLEDTSYYSQATTIQNDIEAGITKIITDQNNAATPLDRIMIYRQNALELENVLQKLLELKGLVNQAESNNSIFGFVGGIQAVSVWGIILIVIAGFVFLSIYMKKLHGQTSTNPPGTVGTDMAQTTTNHSLIGPAIPFIHADQKTPTKTTKPKSSRHRDKHSRMFHILFAVLTTTTLAGMLFGSMSAQADNTDSTSIASETIPTQNDSSNRAEVINQPTTNTPPSTPIVLGQTDIINSKVASSAGTLQNISDNSESNTDYWVLPPSNSAVNVRQEPSLNADVLTKVIGPTPVTITEHQKNWAQVTLTKNASEVTGWVYDEFLTQQKPE